jgi:hypothetical protein
MRLVASLMGRWPKTSRICRCMFDKNMQENHQKTLTDISNGLYN